MRYTLILNILFLIPTYLMAWDSPWADLKPSSAPWTNFDRESRREGFFSGLSFPNFGESSSKSRSELDQADRGARPVGRAQGSVDQEELSGDLSELPWNAHRTLYPNEKFKRQLVWPVNGARVGSGFGLRNGRIHEGVDISGKWGDPIRSIADGRVAYSGRMNGYGNIVVVYHGDGISSVYAHNSAHLVRRGQMVKRGTTVAKVGKSGSATGYHCHFEIRVDGKPVNPFLYTYADSPYIAQR